MNRGVLVYTDLPDIGEILKVFEYYKKDNTTNINIPDVSSFINTIDELNLDDITKSVSKPLAWKKGRRIWNARDYCFTICI